MTRVKTANEKIMHYAKKIWGERKMVISEAPELYGVCEVYTDGQHGSLTPLFADKGELLGFVMGLYAGINKYY